MVVPRYTETFTVLDVGSMDVCGTYKTLLPPHAAYTGLDMAVGKNVDYVAKDPYCWEDLKDNSFDVIISGQCFEHVEFPWLTIKQIEKKLKHGGLVCIIAPSSGHEHRFPVDCYRYYPDGMRALSKWAGLTVLEANYNTNDPEWHDCILIATKQ
jgi:SAM-dependent methyltransferase